MCNIMHGNKGCILYSSYNNIIILKYNHGNAQLTHIIEHMNQSFRSIVSWRIITAFTTHADTNHQDLEVNMIISKQ